MSTVGDVHVGDVGTLYKGEIQDAGAAFDVDAATIKLLIFKKPDDSVVEREATITDNGLTGSLKKWYLEYQLDAGVPEDVTFHDQQGRYQWQGYVEFGDGQKYHTNIEVYPVKSNLN